MPGPGTGPTHTFNYWCQLTPMTYRNTQGSSACIHLVTPLANIFDVQMYYMTRATHFSSSVPANAGLVAGNGVGGKVADLGEGPLPSPPRYSCRALPMSSRSIDAALVEPQPGQHRRRHALHLSMQRLDAAVRFLREVRHHPHLVQPFLDLFGRRPRQLIVFLFCSLCTPIPETVFDFGVRMLMD